jgi:hypothetical protein
MNAVAVLHPCVRCAEASGAMRPACSRCPRCWRWLCAEHLPGHALPSWSDRLPDLLAGRLPDHLADHGAGPGRTAVAGRACTSCRAHALGPLAPPVRLTTRMAVVSAVSVLGMLVSAVGMLVLAVAIGLGGELTVLCMLVAEMTGGALAGRHAERRVDTWLERRARARRARRLPRARLLADPGRRQR